MNKRVARIAVTLGGLGLGLIGCYPAKDSLNKSVSGKLGDRSTSPNTLATPNSTHAIPIGEYIARVSAMSRILAKVIFVKF
jgi:hypothetical protein